MQNKMSIERYDKGKQTITFIMNAFILIGFVLEIITFHKIYLPLQFYLQLFSVFVFSSSLSLLLINGKQYYVLSYLILTYFLLANIVIYDILFPEFIAKINFLKSEFFSRNLFFILPFVAIVGFIAGKRHIIIQGAILLLYIFFQIITNNDAFIKASAINYILTTIGFCWVIYFLVGANQLFIKELKESNSKLLETQQNLIQSEKMASLGTLTAGVAHEINNPLNFIQGGVSGLEDYFLNTKQDKDKNVILFMNGIKTGIARVSSIVKGLNQFSRDTKYNKENCDIHAILDNSLTILQNQIKNRIDIRKNYTSEPFVIQGNVGKLHQVFLNILTNANQAIQEKGSIIISTTVEDTHMNIEITDTGIGISPDTIPKIMEPFFTTKAPGQGTGLGLSISYSIIKDHNGEINVKSQINKGTSVFIKLPLIRKL
jgi:signal transduction histidine kinase